MKYYEIHCETPYCGEDAYYYYKSEELSKVKEYAAECMYENASVWYEEDEAMGHYDDFEQYFEDCSYDIKEITEEEYYEECPWDKED